MHEHILFIQTRLLRIWLDCLQYKIVLVYDRDSIRIFDYSFKENSPWCAQAGLLLASSTHYSAVVKHFGLQLMEHTVKYKWTQITQAEKLFIKVCLA